MKTLAFMCSVVYILFLNKIIFICLKCVFTFMCILM